MKTPLNWQMGDVVFFCSSNKDPDSFSNAVSSCVSSNCYHCGIVVASVNNEPILVHATVEGVKKEPLGIAVGYLAPDYVEWFSALESLTEVERRQVVNFAEKAVGCPYNDIFTANCRNSEGVKSFYCSQLITEAYRDTAVVFPKHLMRFSDGKETDKISLYWQKYFETRKCPIPDGLPGTHPDSCRRARGLKMLACSRVSCARAAGPFVPASLTKTLHFVDGVPQSLGSQEIEFVEPRTGKVLGTFNAAGADDVDRVVSIAKQAQKEWGSVEEAERRSQVLHKTTQLLQDNCEEIAYWESIDNGKPIYESRMDIATCADTFKFYAGVASTLSGGYYPRGQSYAYTQRVPMGVIGCVGAWNYPIQTCTWKIAPALACGNSVVYKPSPLAPISAVILGLLLKEAGLPDGVFNVIQGAAETGTSLVEHPGVNKVSFTGSVQTGKAIMKVVDSQEKNPACAAKNVKPLTLELGGKGALIVCESVDIESAVSCSMMANFFSQGQVCSNASKVLVHRDVLEAFTETLVRRTKALKIGDPLKEDTRVGAYISQDHMTKVAGYIKDAVDKGAKVLCGGEKVDVFEKGFYTTPCVLTDVNSNMRAYNEEIFGSVLMIIPFDDYEEAITIANETEQRLAAGVVSNDLSRANDIANRLEFGNVYVNTYNDVASLVPFGGFGQAGFGKENGMAAIEHYTQTKAVFVNTAKTLEDPFA